MPSWAQEADSIPMIDDHTEGMSSFLTPNELHPGDALPAYQLAINGVYVSVGTERGFIGAANAPAVTHLILFDASKSVTAYNLVNIILIKIAEDRQNYLKLRNAESQEEWLTKASNAGVTEEERRLLIENFYTWKSIRLQNTYGTKFDVPATKASDPFHKVNYLYNDILFNRLKSMASDNRITAMTGRLHDPTDLQSIIKYLELKKVTLSVIDISNAWHSEYMNTSEFVRMLDQISRVSNAETILLITDRWNVLTDLFDLKHSKWNYSAFTYDYIRTFRNNTAFVESIHSKRRFRLFRNLRVYGLKNICSHLLIKLFNPSSRNQGLLVKPKK